MHAYMHTSHVALCWDLQVALLCLTLQQQTSHNIISELNITHGCMHTGYSILKQTRAYKHNVMYVHVNVMYIHNVMLHMHVEVIISHIHHLIINSYHLSLWGQAGQATTEYVFWMFTLEARYLEVNLTLRPWSITPKMLFLQPIIRHKSPAEVHHFQSCAPESCHNI